MYKYHLEIHIRFIFCRRVFGCDAVHPEFQTNALNMVTRQTLDSHLTSQFQFHSQVLDNCPPQHSTPGLPKNALYSSHHALKCATCGIPFNALVTIAVSSRVAAFLHDFNGRTGTCSCRKVQVKGCREENCREKDCSEEETRCNEKTCCKKEETY